MTTEQKKNAVVEIVKSIIDIIKESGDMGTPCGHIYAALMADGCTLPQYQMLESAIINTGLVEKRFDCLVWKDGKAVQP